LHDLARRGGSHPAQPGIGVDLEFKLYTTVMSVFRRFHFRFSSRMEKSVMHDSCASLRADRLKQLKCEVRGIGSGPRGPTVRKHMSGEYSVKGGHTLPWVRKCVVDSEIEASWVQLNSGVFVSPRT